MTDLEIIKQDMLRTAEFAFDRLRGRLRGLTDEEYLWEPAPGCWSVRPADDGTWKADGSPVPLKPAPLTTIAWRLDHLTFVLEGERNATWLGATPVGTPDRRGAAPSAEKARGDLVSAFDLFKRNVLAADASGFTQPMGSVAGPYASDTRAAFVLHELDELIHHASEIAAMRDVYRALHAADSAAGVADMAARERWDDVRRLVEQGSDVNASGGITALHYAAVHGRRDIAELLVENGADPAGKDTEFEQDAAGWAAYGGHEDLASYLRGVSSAG